MWLRSCNIRWLSSLTFMWCYNAKGAPNLGIIGIQGKCLLDGLDRITQQVPCSSLLFACLLDLCLQICTQTQVMPQHCIFWTRLQSQTIAPAREKQSSSTLQTYQENYSMENYIIKVSQATVFNTKILLLYLKKKS